MLSPSHQIHVYTADRDSLLCEVEIVAEPLPAQDLVDAQAGVAVSQRQEECPAEGDESQNNHAGDPGWNHARTCESLTRRHVPLGRHNLLLAVLAGGDAVFGRVVVKDKLNQSTCHECRRQMSR